MPINCSPGRRWIAFLLCCPLACNPPTLTSKDLSGFDDFRTDYYYAPYPCECAEGCPIGAHIVHQADGIYHVEFDGSSRDLTSEEADQLKELFRNVEFANTLWECITRTAAKPCPIYFYWTSLDGSSTANGTNAPCMLGADPLTSDKIESIVVFVADLQTASSTAPQSP